MVAQLVKKAFAFCVWNPKIHYHVDMVLPLVRILNQMNPAHILFLYKNHFNFILLSTPKFVS
jgi:hypothetical protein